jgi:hypothetical protein
MARFYGSVQGGRGEATRLGHATSGLRVTAQSYTGDVRVTLYDFKGEDWCRISVAKHADCSPAFYLYEGPISRLMDAKARTVMMQAMACDMLADHDA